MHKGSRSLTTVGQQVIASSCSGDIVRCCVTAGGKNVL